MEVVFPWTINREAEKWQWAIGFFNLKGIPSSVWSVPKNPKVMSQIEKLTLWSLGSRNFILCMCQSPSYMRSLYPFVFSTFVCTTGERAEIADIQDIVEAVDNPDGDKMDAIEYADLLIVPYCDPDNRELKFRRGAIANFLQRRKQYGRSTITDLFIENMKFSPKNYEVYAKNLIHSFGPVVKELFQGDRAKLVGVGLPVKKEEQQYGRQQRA